MSGYRLVLVTKPMAHHGTRAGYNVLTQHLDADHVIRVSATTGGRWLNGLTRRAMKPWTGSEWYGAAGLWGEMRAWAMSRPWIGQRVVVHVMYGEDLLWTLPRLPRRARPSGWRLVATFHQPPNRLAQLVRSAPTFHGLDAMIALDPSNAAHLADIYAGRVHTLSLGIDDAYWSAGGARMPGRVLFVGNHLRDFALLEETIRRAEGLTFDLVVPARRAPALKSLPRTTVHCGIPDDALRALYRRAQVFFLPLTAASANNAILQALACGTPIVATDLPGVASYVPSEAGLLAAPGDPEGHLRALRRFVDDFELARRASVAARSHAALWGWKNVAARHRALYEEL